MISAEIEKCAGIDVGKKFLAVCIMVGPLQREPRVEHRTFGTTEAELEALRGWLQQEGITPRGHGEYRVLLETGVQHFGRCLSGMLGQSAAGEAAQRT